MIMWIITLLTGLVGMPLISWLKNVTKWKDEYALLLAGTVSAGLALFQLWLTGFFVDVPVTIENFVPIFNAVMLTATIFFKALKFGAQKFGIKLNL